MNTKLCEGGRRLGHGQHFPLGGQPACAHLVQVCAETIRYAAKYSRYFFINIASVTHSYSHKVRENTRLLLPILRSRSRNSAWPRSWC